MRDAQGRFIKGNEAYWKGKTFPAWYKKKLSDAHKKLYRLGKNLPPSQFKGDEVSYGGLHIWINKHFEKVEECENCGSRKNLDWSNQGIYNRERKNWKRLCRKCHMCLDKRNYLP